MHRIIATFSDLYEHSNNYVFFKNRNSEYLYANSKMRDAARLKKIEGKTDLDLPWASFSEKYQQDDNYAMRGELFENVEPFIENNNQLNVKIIKIPILESGYVIGVLGQSQIIKDNNLQKSLTKKRSLQNPLTKRQTETLYLMLHGNSAREISDILSISKRTVESHIENIKYLYHCHTKSDLIAYAFKQSIHLIKMDVLQTNEDL